MKELSIEEKAKAYDEALKVLHKYDGANIMFSQSLKEEMFPELKESEDEKIWEAITNIFKSHYYDNDEIYYGVTIKDMLVWLERQGDHTKFRDSIQIGDQVTRNQDGVLVNLSQLKRVAKPADKVELKFKVKYAGSEYNVFETKDIAGVTYYGIEDEPNHIDYVLPDNCEIVSEQKPAWSEEDESIMNAIYKFLDGSDALSVDQQQAKYWLKSLKDRVQPQPVQEWSKFDDQMLEAVLYDGKNALGERHKEWIKSLKDRVQSQSKPEWSEEDLERVDELILLIEEAEPYLRVHKKFPDIKHESISLIKDWLKSLRLQSQWKPSDEQIKALKEACNEHWEPDGLDPLYTLYQNLKKLREE